MLENTHHNFNPSLTQQQSWDENILLREMTHRINNEFSSAIGLVHIVAARSDNLEVKQALSRVADRLHDYAGCIRRFKCRPAIDRSMRRTHIKLWIDESLEGCLQRHWIDFRSTPAPTSARYNVGN